MKILAGRFGGRKIKTSKNLPYRPTKSLVRKSLFDHLTPFEYNSVLDLFSGSGILGFEAGSRGADSIVFVEKDQGTLRYLKQNSDLLVGPEYSFYGLDAFIYLEKKRENFDLIFADPPRLAPALPKTCTPATLPERASTMLSCCTMFSSSDLIS